MSVCKTRAWEQLEQLSFVRVAGTEEDLKTAQILKGFCDAAGVPAVIEDFEVDVCQIPVATLEILEPEYRAIPVIGIGNTKNTPQEGLVGGFQYIEDGLDSNLMDVAGKVVLLQGRVTPELCEKLEKKGALAYVSLFGDLYQSEAMKAELRPSNARGDGHCLPGLRIHVADAEKLVLAKPQKVKVVLQSEMQKAKAHNVVATLEGTDLKDEIIAFSAHCDSVEYSKGSWDNATGCINLTELMYHFKEVGTRRTMKFIWCGAEEIGLLGSVEYCKRHAEEMEKIILNINFDMTGVTIGFEKCCCSTSEDTLHAIEYLAKLNNYPVHAELGTYSSDSTSFAGAGVPAVTFARLSVRGGAQIHNHHDTMERLDPDSFLITLNFVVKFAEQLANAPINPIPRKFAPSVNEKLEERKKWMAKEEEKKAKKEAEAKESGAEETKA